VKTWQDRAAGDISRGAGIAGSLALHGALILSVVFAGRTAVRASSLPSYRVELVAAPRSGGSEAAAAQPAPITPPPAAPAPAPKPAVAPPKPVVRTPAPAPVRTPPARTPAAPAPVPNRSPSSQPPAPSPQPGTPTPNTNAAPGNGTDAATIRTEGVEFPFPGYLRNLVAQVYRRWRPPAGNADLEAEMLFFVHRDGSISGLQFVKRSGSFPFDLEAQGAVEATARAGAFGALPTGFGPDMLPVSFFFSPRALR
jgi:protein TonB